jgi:small-conductance mechanosensitive channel
MGLPPPAATYGTFVPPTGFILVAALMLAAGAGVWSLAWLVFRAVAGVARRTPGEVDDRLVRNMGLPLSAFLGVVAAGAVLGLFGSRADPALVPLMRNLFIVAFVAVGAWVLVRAARQALEAAGRRQARLLPATRVTGRLVAVVVFTAAFLMILQQYGISVTPLIAGLGIAGLAAALALQDTLGNFFAGLSIQTGQAFQPGHYVRLETDKLDGYVEEIGWRTTHIRTLAGNTVVIPNSKLAQAVVTDYYLPSKDMSVVMEVHTGLEADAKKVIDALVEEAKAAYQAEPERFDTAAEPFAQFSGVTDYALKFSLIIRIPEYVQQWAAQHAVWLRVVERFRKDGIRIPYPTRHNYQEPVKPEAHRIPSAPGGLGPRSRPKPRSRAAPTPVDPREAEAHKARTEIAAKQEKELEKE